MIRRNCYNNFFVFSYVKLKQGPQIVLRTAAPRFTVLLSLEIAWSSASHGNEKGCHHIRLNDIASNHLIPRKSRCLCTVAFGELKNCLVSTSWLSTVPVYSISHGVMMMTLGNEGRDLVDTSICLPLLSWGLELI